MVRSINFFGLQASVSVNVFIISMAQHDDSSPTGHLCFEKDMMESYGPDRVVYREYRGLEPDDLIWDVPN